MREAFLHVWLCKGLSACWDVVEMFPHSAPTAGGKVNLHLVS